MRDLLRPMPGVPWLYGFDVSSYQSPLGVPWSAADFGIAKCSEGAHADRARVEHVTRARAGTRRHAVGGYHFFRFDVEAQQQIDTACAALHSAGIAGGDILPAMDLESVKLHPADPSWNLRAEAVARGIAKEFGGLLLYLSHRDWVLLGSPVWVLEFDLWVAIYSGARWPVIPGPQKGSYPDAFSIWQYRVGAFTGWGTVTPLCDNAQGALDHNRAQYLPRIAAPAVTAAPTVTAAPLLEIDWHDDWTRERDRVVQNA